MQKIYKIIFRLKLKYKANIVFDSRLLKENDIFIGLKTKNNDGSLYYRQAIKKKASLVIVNKKSNHPKSIYIKDTQKFVKSFCKFILESYKGKIIAITGSVGKTTFKENIYYILKKNNFKTYRSYKNYNNILGLQFSIMNMKLNSDYSIFELGINRSNEMTKLVKTLNPHYCLITGIENSHIGNFRNFNHLIENKLKIFNSKRLISGMINYNYNFNDIENKIDQKVQLLNIEDLKKNITKYNGYYHINFTLNNRKHLISSKRGGFYANIALLSYSFIKLFVNRFSSNNFFYNEAIIESRGNEVSAFIESKKVKFFDHSYNASPYSLNKQILIFNERNINQKVYLLGSMKELGNHSDYFHMQIIEMAIKLNLKTIFVGNEFYKFKKKFTKFNFYKNYLPVISYLNQEINNIKNIFVMGSRSNQLDRVIKKYVK